MKYILILLIALSTMATAETKQDAKEKQKMEKAIKEIQEQERKFAKEQKFYQGKDYNLKEHEVDKSLLQNIEVPKIENFEMGAN